MGWMAGQAIPRIKSWEKARPAEAETHEELFDRIAKSIQTGIQTYFKADRGQVDCAPRHSDFSWLICATIMDSVMPLMSLIGPQRTSAE
jgi:hypothetical protein